MNQNEDLQMIERLQHLRDSKLKEEQNEIQKSQDAQIRAKELKMEANQLDGTINILKKNVNMEDLTMVVQNVELLNILPLVKGFPYNGKPIDMAIFVMREAGRFLIAKEIYTRVEEIVSLSDFKSKVGNLLLQEFSRVNNPSKLAKIKIGQSNNNTVWGFEDWLTKEGKIKQEHKYLKSNLYFSVSEDEEEKVVESVMTPFPQQFSILNPKTIALHNAP